jgi:hypothetical protein
MPDILSFVIVGTAVSGLVQYIKNKVGTERNTTIAVVLVLSVVAGAIYHFLGGTEAWKAGLQVLLYANAVYGFLISRFQ